MNTKIITDQISEIRGYQTGSFLAFFLNTEKRLLQRNSYYTYMIDQEKTGFESSRQVMNALKLLNSPYLPSNQRYESHLLLMSYRIQRVFDNSGSEAGYLRRGLLIKQTSNSF